MSNHGKGKQPLRETIEVEDDDARLERMQRVLEKLNTDGSPAPRHDMESLLGATTTSSSEPGNEGDLNELLARVQAFLPQMEASNAALAEKVSVDPRSVDIENVEGDQEVVQMKLGLGVFEDRTGREGSDSESDEEMSSGEEEEQTSSDSDTSDESSSSEDDSASSEEDSDDSSRPNQGRRIAPLPKRALLDRAIRPLPRRGGPPEIVVLSETTTTGS
ncbi:hypothetical protein C8F04DRAFT_1103847 [Mycena alexandri]|uniref:Uncharacterized protein n=1 Tax=Mycena alexandri TaxID=1745969 RepID=A0AAD6SWP1_9AGAR|nr:hypothetical protein C8F04DRAFT_1103847 [Mycena alexandri]